MTIEKLARALDAEAFDQEDQRYRTLGQQVRRREAVAAVKTLLPIIAAEMAEIARGPIYECDSAGEVRYRGVSSHHWLAQRETWDGSLYGVARENAAAAIEAHARKIMEGGEI